MFDVHTPLPIAPCNGAQFAHGSNITYIWHSIPFRYNYTLRSGSLEVTQLDTSWTGTAITPGQWTWTVVSTGAWGTSDPSQPCDYTILEPTG